MEEITVSVVIPLYNCKRYIRESVESVLSQTAPVHEVIVVDDGSTDGGAAEIQDHIDSGRIRYHYQSNHGLSAARNAGIRLATGSHIAFIDSDDVWAPNKIALQKEILVAHDDVGLVHTNIACIDESGRAIPGEIEGLARKAQGRCFDYVTENCAIGISSVVVPRAVLDEVGLFEERVKGAEDYELYLRIAHKYPIHHVDELLSFYRIHESNMSADHVWIFKTSMKSLDLFRQKIGEDASVRRVIRRGKSRFHFLIARRLYQGGGKKLEPCWYLLKSLAYNPLNAESLRLLSQVIIPNKVRKDFRWYKKRLLERAR